MRSYRKLFHEDMNILLYVQHVLSTLFIILCNLNLYCNGLSFTSK